MKKIIVLICMCCMIFLVGCEEKVTNDIQISEIVKLDSEEHYGKIIMLKDFPESKIFKMHTMDASVLDDVGRSEDKAYVPLVFDENFVLYTPKRYNKEIEEFIKNRNNESDIETGLEKNLYATDLQTFHEVTDLKEANSEYAQSMLNGDPFNSDEVDVMWFFDPYVDFFEKRDDKIQKINMRINSNNNKQGTSWYKKGNIVYTGWSGITSVSNYVGHTGGISQEPLSSSYDNAYLMTSTKTIEASNGGSYLSAVTIGTPNGVFERKMSQDGVSGWAHHTVYSRFALWRNGMTSSQRNHIKNYMSYQIGKDYLWNHLKYTENYWYCSKLQWRAYLEVLNIDIDNDRGWYVTPNDIARSNELVGVSF